MAATYGKTNTPGPATSNKQSNQCVAHLRIENTSENDGGGVPLAETMLSRKLASISDGRERGIHVHESSVDCWHFRKLFEENFKARMMGVGFRMKGLLKLVQCVVEEALM